MSICFLLVATDTEQSLFDTCHALRPALRAGDQVLMLETHRSARLRTFDWRGEGEVEIIDLSGGNPDDPNLWALLARTRSIPETVMVLRAGDLVQIDPLEALRESLASGENRDVTVANRAFHLVGPHSLLPCPDALRWLEGGAEGREAANILMADPARLVLSQDLLNHPEFPRKCDPADWYDEVLRAAPNVALFGAPVVLSLPLQSGAEASLNRLRDAMKRRCPVTRISAAFRLGDQLELLKPEEIAKAAKEAVTFFRTSSWRHRRALTALPGASGKLFAAIRSGGEMAAINMLLFANARRHQAHTQALYSEIIQLRADLEAALPGPEYLQLMHKLARQ